jgi:hypothetical protein
MKKLLILLVVVAMVLVVAPAAFAGNGNGNGDGTGNGGGNGGGSKATVVNYSLSGTVTEVGADSITLTVVKGNKAARAYKGQTVTLNLTAATLLYERTADRELVAATLADFAVGDRVNSSGTLDRSDAAAPVFTAKRATIALPVGTCRVP